MSSIHPLLQHYAKLTEFLGAALGPDYEVALHDLTDKNRSIIAIANGRISGRNTGSPISEMTQKLLEQKEYETIESDIEKLETEIASLDVEILKNASNYGTVPERCGSIRR